MFRGMNIGSKCDAYVISKVSMALFLCRDAELSYLDRSP
jgi:hypothetical protein